MSLFFTHELKLDINIEPQKIDLKEFLDEIVSYGIIDGIECEHRKHSPEEIKWLKKYCDDHKLLKSGGSDKHTKNHFLGYSNNNNRVIQSSLVEEWIDKIEPFYAAFCVL